MTPEQWEQIGEVYHEALELVPAERGAFLDRVCAGDEEFRREIETLLAAEKSAGDFIAAPAMKDAAKMLAEDGASSTTTLSLGRTLGQYEIISLLGKGGMGEVYLAFDPRLDRKVALKLLLAGATRDEAHVRRFIQEAKAVSALNHPNIITIHEIGEADGRRYIATEFIEGQTLRQSIKQGALPLSAARDIAAQVASALGAAHAAGIVHRDIKPENIMLRPDGLVKVLDFGLAKLTERAASTFETNASTLSAFKTAPGTVMGTAAYMSPEQARGLEVDARSDIFSLGVVCHEMIAGRKPFHGATINHTIVAILDDEPAPLAQAPDELRRIVSKALAKEPANRYQAAEALLLDLKALTLPATASDPDVETEAISPPLLPSHPTTPPAPVDAAPTRRLLHRHRRTAAIATAAAILAIVASFFYVKRAPALTEKDTVLLADFDNPTGDEVFDNTLRQALAVQLEQTPFLNFFPEDRIRETLRYMNRPVDSRLSKDLAREICQRQGVKAVLAGSIAQFDRRYAITLEAIDSQTGVLIAGALAEAEGKDQVLRALGQASMQLRERLGESLASIQKFAAPLEQATTSSLEALKAWSRGLENARSGRSGAVAHYKRATELDPNFAKAYVSLSLAHSYQEQPEPAAEYATKAFALKDRVTERERFDIVSNYHATATGDLLQAIEALELWRQTYPRDSSPPSRLASYYRLVGQLDKSIAAAREAHQFNPRAYVPYVSLGSALLQANRFDEAQTIIEQGLQQQIGTATSRRDLYQIALVRGDAGKMKEQLDEMMGKADEYWAFHWQAQVESFAGRMREAQNNYRRAAELAGQRSAERAAWFAEEALLRDAVCGLCSQVKTKPPASSRIRLQPYIPVTVSRSLSLALCSDAARAQSLADEIAADNPHSTLVNAIWLPALRAAIELRRGNADQAVQVLRMNDRFEESAMFWPAYLRGLAQLQQKSNSEAALEFRKILDHRGWDATSPLYPLARLGLARALALAGDATGSRQAYQQFLIDWKDADSDLPILIEARREFEMLKP
jgi:serine/threonine protein kinase/protein involved in temperature-dependent protein secretion